MTGARRSSSSCRPGRRATTRRCTRCSTRRRSKANPKISFLADYRRANRSATAEKVTIGRIGALRADGRVRVPVTVTTDDFGKLEGTLTFKASETEDGVTRVAWAREQRLPGLRRARRSAAGAAPRPPAATSTPPAGKLLNSDALGRLDRRRGGQEADRPGAHLRRPPGRRAQLDPALRGPRDREVEGRRGRSITTTIRLGLQRTAQNALGERLGGIAVIKPSDGSVLALAGLAVSAPQPPGSSFKIITAAAALQHGVAKPSSSYPVRTGRSWRRGAAQRRRRVLRRLALELLRALLQLGLRAAGRQARRQAPSRRRGGFGFNEKPEVPAAKVSTIPKAKDMRDSLAVGASAIGQDKDLATPLEMASVAATIANRGVASSLGWPAAATRASASCARRSPARCAT